MNEREILDMYHYSNFPDFYENPAIMEIAKNERWTWSMGDNGKIPADLKEYIRSGKVTGAKYFGPRCLGTLDELNKAIATLGNNTYYLDAQSDGLCVLDIEKHCPDPIKQELLRLPYRYAALSSSGSGYHLIFDVPAGAYEKFPIIAQKRAMKGKGNHFEILLHQYCVFTRRSLPKATGAGNWEELFYSLAEQQKPTATRENFDISEDEPDDIPMRDEALAFLIDSAYSKGLQDFENDLSRYELGEMGHMLRMLRRFEYIHNLDRYSDDMSAWLLYLSGAERIAYRGKHDEVREGVPWLMYTAKVAISGKK